MTSAGISSGPDKRAVRRAFHGASLNIMIIGSTGIGKTSLINSLFNINYDDSPDFERNPEDIKLIVKEIRPQNRIMDFKLTIIEAKGFDNQTDRSKSYKPLVDYIQARYEEHIKQRIGVQDTKYNAIDDTRVHCCIYIINPSANRLKPIDLVTMKQLHQKVCLIPVLARSDQRTRQERQQVKKSIMKEIVENGIDIYSPREYELPLAVAASDDMVQENGKRKRIRSFPWGLMFIERDSDLQRLRDLVLKTDMMKLVDTTDTIHFKKFKNEDWKGRKRYLEMKENAAKHKKSITREINKRQNVKFLDGQ